MSANQKKAGKKGQTQAGAGQAKNHPTAGGNQAARGGAAAGNAKTKESFQKKLLICQKVYDYKDESRDVKAKTERLNAINEIQQLLQD